MVNSTLNPTLDRLFRHMAWANAYVLEQLKGVPESALALRAPKNEWSVGAIVEHFVRAAGFYVTRLGGQVTPFNYVIPSNEEDLVQLESLCAEFDAKLRELSGVSEGMTTYQRDGKTIHRARSTILGQSIHHATEHRAQIAGILSMHGIDAVDLNAIDVWALGDAEGLGD